MSEQREHSDGLEQVLGSWMVSQMGIRLTVWNAESKQRINHSKMPMPLFIFHHQSANAPPVKERLKELHYHKVITLSGTRALWLKFMPPSAQSLWWSHGVCAFMFTASSALFNKWQDTFQDLFLYTTRTALKDYKRGSQLVYYLTDFCSTMLVHISLGYSLLTEILCRKKAYFPKLFSLN